MRVRHTLIFTLYDLTTDDQKQELIKRLNEMGEWLTEHLGVTDWVVAEHIPETFKKGRAHLLLDGIFPNLEAMEQYTGTDVHKRVVEVASKICDWMSVDTVVGEE